MKKIHILFLFFSILISSTLLGKNQVSNTQQQCGTKVPSTQWENIFQSQITEYVKNNANANQRTQTVITIPVIVHVVYYNNNTQQNITKAQIDSQFAILNRDFRGMSEFAGNIPAPFQSLNADIEIEWCPALVDPNGNVLAEPGIERISATSKGFSNPGFFGWETSYVTSTVKPSTIWSPELYCNIWIVPRMKNGFREVLGYATFPTMTTLDGLFGGDGTTTSDGVVIGAEYFGSGGVTQPPYNKGATTVHELGHWLGLRHITGDVDCGNDYCDDTPPQSQLSSDCPSFPRISCSNGPNGDMFMNYMDYSDDACLSMFTPDQKDRMQTAMAYGNLRTPLLNSPVCYTTTPAALANFNSSKLTSTACATSVSYSFTDNSAFSPTSWSWTFEGGNPATSTAQNPTVTFTTPGLHQVTLTATNANGSNTITKSVNVVLVGSTNLPLDENFESGDFPPVGWTFLKRSSAGLPEANWDNISGVSGFGVGNYSMRYDNTTVDAFNQKDDILTPKLDFTGVTASKVKFDVAYAPFYYQGQTGYDTLEVLLTDNCESTVTSIYKKGGTQLATKLPGQGDEFYPKSNEWRTDSIVIPASF
ncbi:MAG: M43 family zinc metalloprotease [Chitinophagales bacterium]